MSKAASRTPLVWAGPIIRRLTPKRLCLWLASSEAVELQLQLQPEQGEKLEFDAKQLQPFVQQLQLAGKLYLYFLDLELNEALPTERWISYDLQLKTSGGDWQNWQQWAEDLVYPGRALPGFVIKPKVHSGLAWLLSQTAFWRWRWFKSMPNLATKRHSTRSNGLPC